MLFLEWIYYLVLQVKNEKVWVFLLFGHLYRLSLDYSIYLHMGYNAMCREPTREQYRRPTGNSTAWALVFFWLFRNSNRAPPLCLQVARFGFQKHPKSSIGYRPNRPQGQSRFHNFSKVKGWCTLLLPLFLSSLAPLPSFPMHHRTGPDALHDSAAKRDRIQDDLCPLKVLPDLVFPAS